MPGNQLRNAGPKIATRIAPSTKSGITAQGEPRDGDRAVERVPAPHGGDHSGEDAERDAEHEGVQREQPGALQRRDEIVGHRASVGVVRPEVPAHGVAQPVDVAHRQGRL